MTEDTRKVIRHSLTQLLSRREHGYHELIQKLGQKGFESSEIISVLDKFREANIQSDVRFVEMHVRNSVSKGQGLQRAKDTLRQLRVSDDDFQSAMLDIEVDWFDLALKAKRKRFGTERPKDRKEKAKQQRFLQYRGFSFEQIEHALTSTDDP
jgi:regulatory protein